MVGLRGQSCHCWLSLSSGSGPARAHTGREQVPYRAYAVGPQDPTHCLGTRLTIAAFSTGRTVQPRWLKVYSHGARPRTP